MDIAHMGPICNNEEYLNCHELSLNSINNFCNNNKDTLCNCYYIDILINHCTKYCEKVNIETINDIRNICKYSVWVNKRPISGLIIDYGSELNDDQDNKFIRDSLL
ncbi:hypothetical protein DAPK24_036680 [Pichia kluyveri]|uniref:Extracellular membrane protein CFEM domain-containing protein n=1 Tax=Pichia kluyveri TaxID=36015 RepID=A0AAV5R7A5_PICKL|nr:hypothetical protein DAPK24_036680 [Pichia kluyveri]